MLAPLPRWPWWLLIALLLSAPLAAPGEPATGVTVTKVPHDERPFEIVGTALSQDNTSATVTLLSPRGIFAFYVKLVAPSPAKLVLVVQKERFCEGLNFTADGGRSTDLRQAKGVAIRQRGADLVIEITAPALELFKAGGRVEFINQYR